MNIHTWMWVHHSTLNVSPMKILGKSEHLVNDICCLLVFIKKLHLYKSQRPIYVAFAPSITFDNIITNIQTNMFVHKLSVILTRATSHMRLRAHDRYTSSTLIGGKGGAGPSSLLHTMLEGPTEYVNVRWM